MLGKWKRTNVDDKGENNFNAERLAEGVYRFLDTNLLLPQKHNGCRKKSRGTNDLLFTDKMVMRKVKKRK